MTRTTGTAAALETELRTHHGRYLRGLRVVARDGGVEVEGEAPDFYRKQLVIRDVLASPAGPTARVRVVVRGGPGARPGGDGVTPVSAPAVDPSGGGRTAVVASGHRRLLDRCAARAARAGYRVVTAVTGLDCLARLRNDRPDLLVLVGNLPWGGSEGVIQAAGESGAQAGTAVVCVGRVVGLDRLSLPAAPVFQLSLAAFLDDNGPIWAAERVRRVDA
jgi:hypothetical protein